MLTKSQQIRLSILDMVFKAGSGHVGGSLSAVEILLALYDEVMRIDAGNPKWEERDRFILSKGHAAPVLYAVLAYKGFFPVEHLNSLRSFGGILQGHPDMRKTPGLDFSSGSLGQGISVGIGMALALKRKKIDSGIYVLLGDGELNEGQIWEAALSAPKLKTDRLICIVDRNGVQLDGKTEDIMPLEPLEEKWRAFRWNTFMANGHDIADITEKLCAAKIKSLKNGAPSVIIARTVKGNGVPFMEGKYMWHGGVMSAEQYEEAVRAVRDGELT